MEEEIGYDSVTGLAVVACTGMQVDDILGALERGDSREELLRAHPGLTDAHVSAVLRFARATLQRQGCVVLSRMPCAPLRTYADVERAMLSAGRERERLACRLAHIERIHDGFAQAASGQLAPYAEAFAEPRD